VYGNARRPAWRRPQLQPRDRHGEILRDAEAVLLSLPQPSRRVATGGLGALYNRRAELQERFRSLAGQQRQGNGGPRSPAGSTAMSGGRPCLRIGRPALDGVFNWWMSKEIRCAT